MILTPTQKKIFEKGIAAANNALPIIDYLERVAQDVPHIAERVAELRTRRDYLTTMCESCLAADRIAGQ